MSSLEDLVTGNLAPQEELAEEEFKPLPPLEALASRARASSGQISQMCQEIPEKIKREPSSAPYLLSQLLAYLSTTMVPGREKSRTLWALALAATYAQNQDPETYKDICNWTRSIEESIQEKEYRRMEKIALPSTTGRLDFLAEFFEDDFIAELVYITGVRPATAKRWIGGAGINWSNSQQIHLLARIFYALRHRQGLQNEEALQFYKSAWQDSGLSPREMMQSYTYISGPKMRGMLRSIGIRE